jgi:4-hydroxy-3-methylbut-2-enyl diphosphate reductase
MEAVQAQVLSHYRSELVDRIRARGNILSAGGLTIRLAKEFGFCYGVERAIDLAYAARKYFPNQPIYILGEIIHNRRSTISCMNWTFVSSLARRRTRTWTI